MRSQQSLHTSYSLCDDGVPQQPPVSWHLKPKLPLRRMFFMHVHYVLLSTNSIHYTNVLLWSGQESDRQLLYRKAHSIIVK